MTSSRDGHTGEAAAASASNETSREILYELRQYNRTTQARGRAARLLRCESLEKVFEMLIPIK